MTSLSPGDPGGIGAPPGSAFADIRRGAPGASLQDGVAYHDVPGFDGPVYRLGSMARARLIAAHLPDSLAGRYGIDLGCSVGGITKALHEVTGAPMIGVDYDHSSIEWAHRNIPECEFIEMDLADPDLQYILELPAWGVWLSSWMWLAKGIGFDPAVDVFRRVSKRLDWLAFETSEGPRDGAAGRWGHSSRTEVRAMLEGSWGTISEVEFSHALDTGRWNPDRRLWICQR